MFWTILHKLVPAKVIHNSLNDNSRQLTKRKGREVRQVKTCENRVTASCYFPTRKMACPLKRRKFGLNFSCGVKKLCPL